VLRVQCAWVRRGVLACSNLQDFLCAPRAPVHATPRQGRKRAVQHEVDVIDGVDSMRADAAGWYAQRISASAWSISQLRSDPWQRSRFRARTLPCDLIPSPRLCFQDPVRRDSGLWSAGHKQYPISPAAHCDPRNSLPFSTMLRRCRFQCQKYEIARAVAARPSFRRCRKFTSCPLRPVR